MAMFAAFSAISIFRYARWPEILPVLIQHETHALFLGTVPMAFVTIVSGIAFVGEDYGLATARAASALWWAAGLMSLATAFGVPIAMFKYHKHASDGITALWLLPVVPPITMCVVRSSSQLTGQCGERGNNRWATRVQ